MKPAQVLPRDEIGLRLIVLVLLELGLLPVEVLLHLHVQWLADHHRLRAIHTQIVLLLAPRFVDSPLGEHELSSLFSLLLEVHLIHPDLVDSLLVVSVLLLLQLKFPLLEKLESPLALFRHQLALSFSSNT